MSDRTPDPTPCPEREESLALHAGGDLPPDAARELERHLARCPGCRTFLSELGESLRVFELLAAEPAAGELAAVHRRVMENVREESGGATRRRALRWAVAAALLLALGAALLWRLGTFRGPEPRPSSDPVIARRAEEPAPPRTEVPDRSATPKAAQTPEPERPETAHKTPTALPATRSKPPQTVPEPETQRAGLEHRPDLKIQLVSDDPGIVIYWLVETEKPHDATPTT